ncbi:hypothetical protein ACJX0J_011405, partial [Zea mays]
ISQLALIIYQTHIMVVDGLMIYINAIGHNFKKKVNCAPVMYLWHADLYVSRYKKNISDNSNLKFDILRLWFVMHPNPTDFWRIFFDFSNGLEKRFALAISIWLSDTEKKIFLVIIWGLVSAENGKLFCHSKSEKIQG